MAFTNDVESGRCIGKGWGLGTGFRLPRNDKAGAIEDVTDACAHKGVPADQDGGDLLEKTMFCWEKLFLMHGVEPHELSYRLCCLVGLEWQKDKSSKEKDRG
jgi:hypothetical protein